jgi:outer membrane protein
MSARAKKFFFIIIVLVIFGDEQGGAQSDNPPEGWTLLDAIGSTLTNHPLIRSQQAQVQISRGLQEQAAGTFDLLISSGFSWNRASSPLTLEQEEEDLVVGVPGSALIANSENYGMGFQKLFRNGISIAPQFQVNRTIDNLFNTGGLNTSTLNIVVTVPLLRGRGRAVVAAQEQVAKTEVDATLLDLNQLISQLMSNTATSYWNLLAAEKNLAIGSDSEARAKLYLSQVQILVDADHVPRNDLHGVRANLYQRSSTRVAAEQQVLAAREQLDLDMGRPAEQMLSGLPRPTDEFPKAEDQHLPSDSLECKQYYADQALRQRADYLASEHRISEANILLTASRNRLLPQININLTAGYSGLQEGSQASDFFTAAVNRVPGPNATAGITYSFPNGNHLARGELLQSQGTSIQAAMQSQQLARVVTTEVVVALEALRSAILRAKNARQSVDSFQAALLGEREKYAGGFGSIVDVLSMEDRLTAALTDQVQSELAYTIALAQFRFATGTLVQARQSLQNVHANTFVTFPFACGP